MRVHLTVDFVASALLAVGPFLFGYSNLGLNPWLPQVVAGVSVILLGLVSMTEPQRGYARQTENTSTCQRLANATWCAGGVAREPGTSLLPWPARFTPPTRD
jgi:hypothetical protein